MSKVNDFKQMIEIGMDTLATEKILPSNEKDYLEIWIESINWKLVIIDQVSSELEKLMLSCDQVCVKLQGQLTALLANVTLMEDLQVLENSFQNMVD